MKTAGNYVRKIAVPIAEKLYEWMPAQRACARGIGHVQSTGLQLETLGSTEALPG